MGASGVDRVVDYGGRLGGVRAGRGLLGTGQ